MLQSSYILNDQPPTDEIDPPIPNQTERTHELQDDTQSAPNSGSHVEPPLATQNPHSAPLDLMIVGNSNTREIDSSKLYRNKMTKVVELRNKTVNGAIRYILGMKEDGIKPKVMAYMLGTNELSDANATTDSILDAYVTLVESTRQKCPDTEIVIIGVPPRRGRPESVKNLNEHLIDLCKDLNVYFSDNSNLNYNYHLKNDKIHLNDEGIKSLVKNLKITTNPLLGLKARINPVQTPPRRYVRNNFSSNWHKQYPNESNEVDVFDQAWQYGNDYARPQQQNPRLYSAYRNQQHSHTEIDEGNMLREVYQNESYQIPPLNQNRNKNTDKDFKKQLLQLLVAAF